MVETVRRMREDRVSMIQTKVWGGGRVVVVDTGEDQRGGDGAPDEGGPCQHDTDQGKVVVVVMEAGKDQRGGVSSQDEGGPCQHDTDQGREGWGKYPLWWWWWWWMQERISVVVVVVEEEDAERISVVVVVVVVVDSGCDGVGGGSIGSRCFCETARMI